MDNKPTAVGIWMSAMAVLPFILAMFVFGNRPTKTEGNATRDMKAELRDFFWQVVMYRPTKMS